MDSFATKDGSVALISANRVSTRSTRKSKTKVPSPKKLVENIVSRVASKKLGEGVLQLHKEFVRETSTYFAYWNAANTAKNFKPDRVLLYDWNRVVLTDGADYYHASFVDGCVRNSQYILAQAPFTKDTQSDFFRLVNQTKPDAIILMERADSDEGRLILPGKETKCGGITIKSDEEIRISAMDIHTLLVAGKQKVKVFCINGWNTDSETPKNLLDVHDKIRKMIGYDNKGILLIVCKDGVSRCGIFTLLDIEAERIRTKSRVKLGDTVRTMRFQRSNVFDTLELFDAGASLIISLAKKNMEK